MSDEFPEKYRKILQKNTEDFMGLAEGKSTDEVKQQILKSQGNIADLESQMDNDVKLQALKEDVKLLAGSYKDEIKLEHAKSAFCVHLLRSRGTDVNS